MLRRFLASLMVASVILSPAAFAADKTASAFNDKQRAELNDLIKKYIADHPTELIASVEAHYNKQAETKKVQEGPLESFPAGLIDNPNSPSFGPKDAKVAVIEFFDYNCGYCKQVAGDVDKLIKEDKSVRVIFKELPILSETSEVAARYALAANKQGKYLEFHNALMNTSGLSENTILATAKNIGLDVDKLKGDASTQDVRDELAKNVDLARGLGVRGTPFFVIGKEKIPGAIGLTRMKEIIAEQSGAKPAAAAAPSAAAPVADAAPAAAPAVDPAMQAEINKAKSEAQAMINEIKAEAEKMQKDAMEQKRKAEAEVSKGKK